MVVQQAFSSDARLSGSVTVFIISPSTQSERHFPISTSISDLKDKLVSITGIPASFQILSLQDGAGTSSSYNLSEGGQPIATLSDDSFTLADYGLDQDGYIIKVTSSDNTRTSTLQAYTDDPNVEKFELSPEEYSKRTDTVMAYKARNKIGRFAESDSSPSSLPSLPSNLTPGARVRVDLSSTSIYTRLGTVRYIGEPAFAPGIWVGIEYDEPVGKNDGSVDGERYFSCKMKYGGFVRPEKCTVGEWAKEGMGDDEDGLDTDDDLGL